MLLFRGQFISLILLPGIQIYFQICCSPCSPIVKQSYVSCIDKMFLLHPITSVAVHCCSQSIHIPISWFLLHFKSFVLAHRQVSTHLLAHSNLQPANQFFSPLFSVHHPLALTMSRKPLTQVFISTISHLLTGC